MKRSRKLVSLYRENTIWGRPYDYITPLKAQMMVDQSLATWLAAGKKIRLTTMGEYFRVPGKDERGNSRKPNEPLTDAALNGSSAAAHAILIWIPQECRPTGHNPS